VRIVAGPAETLAIRDGYVIRDGRSEEETYVLPAERGRLCNLPPGITLPPHPDLNFPTPITIPQDQYSYSGTTEQDRLTPAIGASTESLDHPKDRLAEWLGSEESHRSSGERRPASLWCRGPATCRRSPRALRSRWTQLLA
jgi:hypothetical protein